MTRLRLLAVVLLLGAAPASSAPAPARDDVAVAQRDVEAVAQARAFLKVSCAAAKPSCPQATALLHDYLALLDEALACLGPACKVRKVNSFFERDRALDAREHALPKLARSADSKRPFLKLSLFVMTAAGLALEAADPKAKPPAYKNAEVESAKVVEQICGLRIAKLCDEARSVAGRIETLSAAAAACEAKACLFPEQERLGISAETALGAYFRLDDKTDYDTTAFVDILAGARVRIARLLARSSAAKLAELEAAEKALTAGVGSVEKNPGGNLDGAIAALRAREAGVMKLYQEASIASDRTQSLLGGDPAKDRLRERINVSASRLASARGRLIALKTARGFGAPADGAGVIQGVFAKAGQATQAMAALGVRPAAAPRSVSIDRRAVPTAPPAHPSAPPILKVAVGPLALVNNARSKDPLVKADAMRRLGLTSTLGDPSGRAALLHPQEGDDTCAIVAQQQILMAHGLIPKSDPLKNERLLAQEAVARGFYIDTKGTPRAYQADLLVDRGLIVTKQAAAPIKALDAAVRRGGMVIASVDARYLWNQKGPKPMGHAVLITGAEIDRFSGETLGYYINDSGVRKNGAGRFVPIEQFKKAWNSHTKSFSEVR